MDGVAAIPGPAQPFDVTRYCVAAVPGAAAAGSSGRWPGVWCAAAGLDANPGRQHRSRSLADPQQQGVALLPARHGCSRHVEGHAGLGFRANPYTRLAALQGVHCWDQTLDLADAAHVPRLECLPDCVVAAMVTCMTGPAASSLRAAQCCPAERQKSTARLRCSRACEEGLRCTAALDH